MSTNDLIFTLLIGAVSGWLAGQIRQGYGFGLIGNIIVGILGAFVGNWLFRSVLHVSIGSGLVSVIATAVIGALVLLFLIGLFTRR
ncbi:MAG: GlsB/YeaQ/YmgE family stress response membrane protein [Saprospiraceae bacterium]|nr:GlsB/YeaQ/YmgE family stress response membrane protein [Lewinellaceae bacterium]MBP6811103.1 GlsB/YeaQ/YmgE family stress response membrane protein [Saprospiraceae bacterium]